MNTIPIIHLVFGSGIVFVSLFGISSTSIVGATTATVVPEDNYVNTNTEDALSSIFDNVSNSVVQIVSVTPPLFSLNPQAQNTTEVGAGFILMMQGP